MIVGVLLPIVLLSKAAWRRSVRVQIAAPLLVLSGVLMNRFDATLFGQILPAGAPTRRISWSGCRRSGFWRRQRWRG